MNFERIMQLIGRWGGTMKFFPSDPDARIGIAEEILAMASSQEQVRWLVSEAPRVWTEWPAMLEIRALFCSRFDPRDGRQAISPRVDNHTERIQSGPAQLQLSGDVEPPPDADPAFPRDVFSLIADVARERGVKNPEVKPAPDAQIAAIKAQQDANRKESKPQESGKRGYPRSQGAC